MKVLASMGLGETDAELIYAAAHLGKTRYGEEKHGKGMSDLLRLLEEGRSGHMRILSRHGDYAYVHRASGETQHRSDEHTSELQSLMRISYAVFCLQKHKLLNKDHQY